VLLADARLDAIGRSCATLTPTIRAAVARLEPGQVLEIVADDPSAREGLQSWTRLTGHELVAAVTTPDAASRFYVRRAEVRSPAEGNPKGAGR
jgi:tRNA 2-thiouridine synthesizing protein A